MAYQLSCHNLRLISVAVVLSHNRHYKDFLSQLISTGIEILIFQDGFFMIGVHFTENVS